MGLTHLVWQLTLLNIGRWLSIQDYKKKRYKPLFNIVYHKELREKQL